MMTEFDTITWGDPFLAQFTGSDAQAHGTDPAQHSLDMMTTGFEQAPDALVAMINPNDKSNTPTPPADPCKGDPCSWKCIFAGKTNFLNCIDPTIPANWKTHPDPNQGNEDQSVMNPKSWFNSGSNGWIVAIVIALLAIGLVFIGTKEIIES